VPCSLFFFPFVTRLLGCSLLRLPLNLSIAHPPRRLAAPPPPHTHTHTCTHTHARTHVPQQDSELIRQIDKEKQAARCNAIVSAHVPPLRAVVVSAPFDIAMCMVIVVDLGFLVSDHHPATDTFVEVRGVCKGERYGAPF
jgi:hypothetical protein